MCDNRNIEREGAMNQDASWSRIFGEALFLFLFAALALIPIWYGIAAVCYTHGG